MKRFFKRALLGLALLTLPSCGLVGHHPVPGNPLTRSALAPYQGKVVMVAFWSSWCSQCLYELPMLQKLQDRYADRGFTVVGVAVQDYPGKVHTIQVEKGLQYPMIVDIEDGLANAFRIHGVPEIFFLDRSGNQISFIDPKTGETVESVSGLRDWGSPEAASVIEDLLAHY